jgi:hypothetical protein
LNRQPGRYTRSAELNSILELLHSRLQEWIAAVGVAAD